MPDSYFNHKSGISLEEYKKLQEEYSEIYESGIPSHMITPLLDYILLGTPCGGFLTALLSNDLKETFGRSDAQNIRKVREFLTFLYNHAPSDCWGSEEKHRNWIEEGGLYGKLSNSE